MSPIKVLFVCTGNICRSPTAEGVFRHMVKAEGLGDRFVADSCGLGDWHVGDPPDPRAIDRAAKRGYDISDLRARLLRNQDFTEFNHLIAMDEGHYSRLASGLAPGDSRRVRLLMAYAPKPPAALEVPDPYYGGLADYDHALDLIEVGVRGLFDSLKSQYL